MKIGITYDLRDDYIQEGYGQEETAELDKLETIEGIDNALQALGYTTERIGNAKHLIKALSANKRWDLVFNIAEGLTGFGREAAVPAILETYGINYTFSDPMVLSVCLHKAVTKIIARHAGVPTADFFVIQIQDDLKKLEAQALRFPLFIKPVAEGTSKGIDGRSVINSFSELCSVTRDLLKKFEQPLLVESFLTGREFTVCIIGTGDEAKNLGVLEVNYLEKAEQNIYSYINKADYKNRIKYSLLEEGDELFEPVVQVALSAWKALGCRDAGRVDVRMDANGKPMMIEINPLAGLNPVDSDLPIMCGLHHIPYVKLIEMIVNSALSRNK